MELILQSQRKSQMIITIDGPTSSGKSTTAGLLAKKLGMNHLNSGLLYRALAYLLLNKKQYGLTDLYNPLARDVSFFLDPERFLVSFDKNGSTTIVYEQEDITDCLKDSTIDTAASMVSTNALVRQKITDLQRILAQEYDIVLDGRDAGSNVFPNADVKFYLTASEPVRAVRWQQAMASKGMHFALKEAIENIKERDTRDQNRKVAPLQIPDDAIVIDNSDDSIEQTLQEMLECIENKK